MHEVSDFAFDDWAAGMASHYLTNQANASSQMVLAKERGNKAVTPVDAHPLRTERGLQVDLILGENQRAELGSRSELTSWRDAFSKFGFAYTDEEVRELVRLNFSQDIANDGASARLGLMIRAIESWSRT